MNTKISEEIKVDKGVTEKPVVASIMEKQFSPITSALTLSQRAAICFAAGVIGALAVVLLTQIMFGLGLSAMLGELLSNVVYAGSESGCVR
jgi:hypothetical protein